MTERDVTCVNQISSSTCNTDHPHSAVATPLAMCRTLLLHVTRAIALSTTTAVHVVGPSKAVLHRAVTDQNLRGSTPIICRRQLRGSLAPTVHLSVRDNDLATKEYRRSYHVSKIWGLTNIWGPYSQPQPRTSPDSAPVLCGIKSARFASRYNNNGKLPSW